MMAGLCLRFDIDTFSTRTEYIAEIGWGCYPYLQRILALAARKQVTFQFCACGRGLEEYPQAHLEIVEAGHPIDSHLYSHEVRLVDGCDAVETELIQAENAFRAAGVSWTGIGATGMYPEGIGAHRDVQRLLIKRGYRWCSTQYNLAQDLTLGQLQPYWLDAELLEIPCGGMSDRHYFYDADAPVENYIDKTRRSLDQAASHGWLLALCLHPGVLAKYDPEMKFLNAVISYAQSLEIPLLTMEAICRQYKGGGRVAEDASG